MLVVGGSSPSLGTKLKYTFRVSSVGRARKNSSLKYSLDLLGALVQLVRMPPCHGGGHGFESHTHRKNKIGMVYPTNTSSEPNLLRIIAEAERRHTSYSPWWSSVRTRPCVS